MARTVDVYFKGHDKGLGLAIKDVKAELAALRDTAINVKVDVDDAKLDKLKADINSLSNKRVRAGVDVDQAGLTTLKANLNTLANKSVKVRVDTETAQLTALKAQLASLGDKTVTVRVRRLGDTSLGNGFNDREVRIRGMITNLATLETQLRTLTRDRIVNLRLNYNTSQFAQLTQMLSRLAGAGGSLGGGALSGIGSMLGGIVSAATSAVGALLLVSTAASAAAVAAGAIPIALTGALGAVAGAAGAMGAAVTGGLGAAVAALAVLGNEELKNKATSTFDAIGNSLKNIAQGAAPALERFFDALPAAFERMRPALERITAGVGDLVDHLTGQLPAIADQLGPALEKAFNAGVPHLKNLVNNLPRLTEAFGNFMSKLGDPAVVDAANRFWQKLPGLIEGVGNAIPKVAQGFSDLMGWIDAGNLDPFIQGFKDLWQQLSSADWSGTIDSIADLANTWGEFMSSIDGQTVADSITAIATAFDGVLTAGLAVKDTLGGIWDVISPKNVVGEFREMAHALLGMLRDTFGNLPFIGDDITEAIDAALGKLGPVKFKATPEIDKVGVEKLDVTPGPKIKVDVEPQWSGFKAPPELPKVKVDIDTDSHKIPVAVEVQPFKLDIPDKQKVMVEVEAQPFKLDIPDKQKVMVDVDTAGAREKVHNIVSGVTLEVPVTVAMKGDGFDKIKQTAVSAVEIPLRYGPLPPMPAVPNPPPVTVPIDFGPLPPLPAIPAPPPVVITVDVSAAQAAVAQMGSAGRAAGQAFASGVASAQGAVSGAAAGLGAAAQAGVAGISLFSEGAAAGNSFARGLRSANGAVASAARSLGATAKANKGYYKGLKGIAADRVMLIENGQAMAQGFIRGLEGQRGQLIAASRQLAADVRGAFDSDVTPRIGLAGGYQMQQSVTVHVEAGTAADPVTVGREIRDYLDAYAGAVNRSGAISA